MNHRIVKTTVAAPSVNVSALRPGNAGKPIVADPNNIVPHLSTERTSKNDRLLISWCAIITASAFFGSDGISQRNKTVATAAPSHFMPDKFHLKPEPTHVVCGFRHKVKLGYYWNQ